MSGYAERDAERWAAEPDKRSQTADGEQHPRGDFARDRARVLHSYAFRRLADKTQVVSPGQDDFPRTRLTHSLEVAQIAREMGASLGCDPDITDTAGLAHDLGHPPFGHNGEAALDALCGDIGGFEGNAQTLRILTRLEAKVLDVEGNSVGLNLTRAGLDAVCKYPWARREGTSKFGVYADDRAAFTWLRDQAPDGARCLEAQVMDWADDVAYSVHDVEDGVHAGFVRLGVLVSGPAADAERQALCEQAADSYTWLSAEALAPLLDGLLALPALRDLAEYDASFAAQVRSKRATSELTGRFAGAAVAATRARFGSGLTRYAADLIVPEQVQGECALLKAIALRYVMRRQGVEVVLQRQRRLLTELVESLTEAGRDALSNVMTPAWDRAAEAADPDAARRRVVVDQVAQLTDSAAVAWHARSGRRPVS